MGLTGKTVPVASTSEAAPLAQKQPHVAAIASDLAAELFDLPKLAEFIEDDAGNVTRFLIIGTSTSKPTGCDRTSIVFSVGHHSGTLVGVLDAFRTAGINMTRIESRPAKHKRWGYYFFVDVEGHAETPELIDPLKEASARCGYWKVLGAYHRSDEVL